jgi:cyclase
MFRPRVIPVLLLKNLGLVKTVGFGQPKYLGDPINAVRLFNDMLADELVFLDIEASRQGRLISLDFVRNVGEEANMPFAVGGGIRKLSDIQKILAAGAEKVVLGSIAIEKPAFIKEAAEEFGSSTIAVCMDVKKSFWGRYQVLSHIASIKSSLLPGDFALLMQEMGAGELIVQSVDRDGKMQGYDLELLKNISSLLEIPMVALGGAGSTNDLRKAYFEGGASALAAGSLFVYHGPMRGVLISYPGKKELRELFAT